MIASFMSRNKVRATLRQDGGTDKAYADCERTVPDERLWDKFHSFNRSTYPVLGLKQTVGVL